MTTAETAQHFSDRSALLIVDLQNDFLPGGALGVAEGNQAALACRRYLDAFIAHGRPVFLSRDWHPVTHCSFKKQNGPWPDHCVAETPGAQFAAILNIPHNATIISKGTTADKDAYSAFDGTDLDAQLKKANIVHLYIGGLATDYCVRASALDARRLGYEVTLLTDAIAAVNVAPGDGERAIKEMQGAGCVTLSF
jgi:Amidases related to nicotinamidase